MPSHTFIPDWVQGVGMRVGDSPLGLERTDDLLIGKKIDLAPKRHKCDHQNGGWGACLQKRLPPIQRYDQTNKQFIFNYFALPIA